MKFSRSVPIEILLCLLAVGFVVLDVALFFTNKTLFFIVLGVILLIVLLFVLRAQQIRRGLASMITGIGPAMKITQQSLLSTMRVPAFVTDSNNCLLWYNDAFLEQFKLQTDVYLEDITKYIPELDVQACLTELGGSYTIADRHYTVFSTSSIHGADTLYISLMINDTGMYRDAERYAQTRPSVLVFSIDSLEGYEGAARETERAELLSEVYRVMEEFINNTNGIFMRVSAASFTAIIEEQHILPIIEKRFTILDEIRQINKESAPVTMSIGVGRGAKTLYENYIQAHQALDMAQGRGGDQAALKTRNGYDFYGGTNKAVEKRNRVKSRVIANAMVDLIETADNVLVMGHKSSDLDSLGSAAGVAFIAKSIGAKCNIVFDQKNTMARPLFDLLVEEGNRDWFLSPEDALDFITDKTLLVVVDCHSPQLVESEEVLRNCERIVLIDHHRRMVNYIENTVISYHEPYASSCSELVAELIQNIDEASKTIRKTIAEGLLSGIMLDTKNFTVRTGVRTYDAAAYLRKVGADPTDAKQLFAIDLSTYKFKADLVSEAEIYRGCAVVVTETLPENMRVVIPQAADDLLSIEGINASIVAVKFQNRIHISSRSLGASNVQLIMEYLGGGGHQTTAGVQIDDADPDTVRILIHEAIDHYLETNTFTS